MLSLAPFMMLPAQVAQMPPAAPPQGAENPLKDLLDLLNTHVVSASKTIEKISDAPATVLVLSRADIEERGYTELSQILDDLPGMDVVRSYGANYFKNYWRGYRNDIGDPFLVMVDGVAFNHLWFSTADTPLVTYPLSAIERVEVVYGPASAVYGADAFMGVINLVTRKARADGGTKVRGQFSVGSFGSRIADIHATHRAGDLAFSIAARSDKGGMDEEAAERYEYTKRTYYANRQLWGPVVDDPDLAGRAQSLHQFNSMDARITWGDTEFAVQRFWSSAGYGTAYAADESQSLARWIRPDLSFHVRHHIRFGDRVTSTLLARYRRSDVDRDSYDLLSFYGFGSGTSTVFTRYEVLTSSLAFAQDFEVKASERLTVNTGLRVEQKTLQEAYATASGGAAPTSSLSDANHFSTEDRGLYVQGRYVFSPSSTVFVGLRSDHNSVYGTANTLRGGYVGHFGPWGVKALYGQAYQEPTARLLFGATTGTGSNANLNPETSNTTELSGSYTQADLSFSLSAYRVKNHGKIQKLGDAVMNSGDQDISGADLGFHWLVPVEFARQWKVWGYYSHYFKAEDITAGPAGSLRARSGDLAANKAWLGTTLVWNRKLSGTILARIIGARPTVLSNPVREVDGFGTLDLILNAKDLWMDGLGLSLRAANLADKAYFHPGLRDAGAGTKPGGFDAQGVWRGSASFYNSLLPQPGRSVSLTVTLRF
ncbi:MAG: TonB-dependent receptor [Acidobacteriota bacterium]|nr:TonB-dependent receptor [Acidobacteriota bacterium]